MSTVQEYNRAQLEAAGITPEILDLLMEHGGKALQSQGRLTVDGKVGPGTQEYIRGLLAAPLAPAGIPQSRAQLKALYGDFKHRKHLKKDKKTGEMRPSGRVVIDKSWVRDNIVWVRLHTGQRRQFHKLVGPEFVEVFEEACRVSGYTPKSVQTWVARHTLWDTSKKLSIHSWGAAVDFDPPKNGMYNTNSLMHRNPEFVQAFKDAGWWWGGDFKYRRAGGDPMHFQRAGRRA